MEGWKIATIIIGVLVLIGVVVVVIIFALKDDEKIDPSTTVITTTDAVEEEILPTAETGESFRRRSEAFRRRH